MSIQEIKKRKLESIQRSLKQCEGFHFSEDLIKAFQIDSERKSKTSLNQQT